MRKITIKRQKDGTAFLENNSIIAKLSIYDESISDSDRKDIEGILSKKFLNCSKLSPWEYKWEYKCESFVMAYNCEKLKSKKVVCWLLTTILGISNFEAETRFDIFTEIMSVPEFKNKEELLIKKIYLKNNE